MRALLLVIIPLLVGCFTATPLNKQEIAALQDRYLDSLTLRVDHTVDQLRFDIIRQEYEQRINDSTVETRLVAYHPLGFDLGNGLFFDLNKNLSLRLNHLLDIQETTNYSLKKTVPTKRKTHISYKSNEGGEYCNSWTNLFGKEKTVCVQQKSVATTVQLFRKGRLCYTIEKADNKTIYTSGRRQKNKCIIEEVETKNFTVGRRKRKIQFLQDHRNQLKLGRYHLLKYNIEHNRIEIYQRGRKKNTLLYLIKKGKDKLFIYNPRYFGYKIEFDSNQLIIFRNNKHLYKIEREI